MIFFFFFYLILTISKFVFFSSRRRHTRWPRDWSSDVCSSDLPNVLLLLTFEEPSRGSRTTENRPRPTSFTFPISSEATRETSFDSRNASTNTSFIQTSSSSCCSPYTLRVAAGSRRIGNSRRICVESAEKPEKSRPRSSSSRPACCANVTSAERPPSVRGVPSLEVIAELFLPAIEIPPGARVLVGQVREDLEVLHRLRADVLHLPLERLLAERVLPDRAAREEAGCSSLTGEIDEGSEDREIRAGA